MKIFITGASGYIGGSVAEKLMAGGHEVTGLTRDTDKATVLAASGIEPVIGTLEDRDILMREARKADAVVSAADADHRASVEAMAGALEGSGKVLIHTSGSSLVGDDVRGNQASDSIYDEDTPFVVEDRKKARQEINSLVLESGSRGVRSAVICPSLVYGVGTGINPRSIQVPFLVDQAHASGVVRVVGKGLNRWSTVHINDLVDLYGLAVDAAPPGSFYFAENGESSFADIGAAIAERLGLGEVESWDADEAANQWGPGRAYYTYGSNSRVRAKRAREELGWKPTHDSVLRWIRHEMPNEKEGQ
ncbi:NAD-dependent epimerase/dehydratase family protein [Pseudarthrobacter sp. alpha12b]